MLFEAQICQILSLMNPDVDILEYVCASGKRKIH